LLKEGERGPVVEVMGTLTEKELGEKILISHDVSEAIQIIFENRELSRKGESVLSFQDEIATLADYYVTDKKFEPTVSKGCKKCEFRTDEQGLKSGFAECWASKLKKDEVHKPLVFDIWDMRTADPLIDAGTILMKDVEKSDLKIKTSTDKSGMSRTERQWMQVDYHRRSDSSSFFDAEGLAAEADEFIYPLHFIDFETSRVAIPFHNGMKPYEQIAFQFSHHLVHEDGRVEHKGQFISCAPGEFPNFNFIRALKTELEGDSGTIFRYSHHENSVLCDIHRQLAASKEADRDELMAFIETITACDEWEGDRSMIDLCDLYKRYHYNPATNGSNSLKFVLPAILDESTFLQKKYSLPIYGGVDGIVSLNFKSKVWLQKADDRSVLDPYKQLAPIFEKYDTDSLDRLMGDNELKNGGAAMTAYLYLQYVEMGEIERKQITDALLRYCELDTLAMVMIYEHWMDLIKRAA
jgi:hypothetical protein